MTSPNPDPEPHGGTPGLRRAATWPGRHAAWPAGTYDPDPPVSYAPGAAGVAVHFTGEDGRTRTFLFATLPLLGWHADFATAFAKVTGPTGSMRTLNSAQHVWGSFGRLLRFLDKLSHPPRDVTHLTARHLRQFELDRRRACKPSVVASDLRTVRRLLGEITPQDRLPPDVVEWLGQRWREGQPPGAPGYSEQEFRRIIAAARQDVVAIRDRIRTGERLLARVDNHPETLSPAERAAAAQLQAMASSGEVPRVRVPGRQLLDPVAELKLAKQLFLIDADLAPLMVLGVGLTGRNSETLKELPARHELLAGRAVAIELIKRRRRPNNIHEVVHWEVGPPSRQLHTGGGYYLLVHELARRGRPFSASESIWSIWNVRSGHISPFAKNLGRKLYLSRWAREHKLLDDDGQPLELSLNRLRTTVEVRTSKATGGHLPTSARSNTMDVQFAHYLRGDPSVMEWAASEVTAALHDAEQQARQAHLRVLGGPHGQDLDPAAAATQLGVDPEVAQMALAGELDTLVTACLDINDSPFNEGRCQASFLTCLRCRNALATHRHLPGLLALLDQLDADRQTTDADSWWARHGQVWLAITQDVLPKFTPAELKRAHAEAAANSMVSLLELLNGPREQP
jgi:hypothetical protein